MPKTAGRPRLTPEQQQARIRAYCAKYDVAAPESGLPPFPAGRRETPQHREWIALYKAHNRLARRERGQCERCSAPAGDGSVFCDAHRASAAAGHGGASEEDRQRLLERQDGRCPICRQNVDLWDSVDHDQRTGRPRAILHQRCSHVVGFAEALGPEVLDRLRAHLWPPSSRPRSRVRAKATDQ